MGTGHLRLLNTNDRPKSGARSISPFRPSGFNKGFLLLTSAALVAWVIFLLVLALKY
jgi:hypothetical protein